MKIFNSEKMGLISVGCTLRLFVLVSVFCLLGVNCSRMWSSFDKRQLSAEKKRCLPPCKIFHSWCKNDGKCREKGPDCSWYCECPDNCEGFFCEKVIENVDGKNKTTVKIKEQFVPKTKKNTIIFDSDELAKVFANIHQKNHKTVEPGKPAEPIPIQRVNKTIKVKENITVTGTFHCPPDKTNNDLQNKTTEATVSTSASTEVPKRLSLKNDSSTLNTTSTKSTSVAKMSISELMRKNHWASDGAKSNSRPGYEVATSRSKSEAYSQNKQVNNEEIKSTQRKTLAPVIGSKFSNASGNQVNNTSNMKTLAENVTLSNESKGPDNSTRKTTTYTQNKTSSDTSANLKSSTAKPLTSQTKPDNATSQTTQKSTLTTQKDELFININSTSVKPTTSPTVSNFTSTSASSTIRTKSETTNTVQSTGKQTVRLTSTGSSVIKVETVASSKSMPDLKTASTETTTYSTAQLSQQTTNLEPKLISTKQTILEPTKYPTSTMGDVEVLLNPNKTVQPSSTTVDPSPLVVSSELPRKQMANSSSTKMVTARQTTTEVSGITINNGSNSATTTIESSTTNNYNKASSTGGSTSSITSASTTQTPNTTEIFSTNKSTTQGKEVTHTTPTSIGGSLTSSQTSASSQTTSTDEKSSKTETMTSRKNVTHMTPTSISSSTPNFQTSSTTLQTTVTTLNEITTQRKKLTSVTPTNIRFSTTDSKANSTTPQATITTELLSKKETTIHSEDTDRMTAISRGNTKTSITSITTTSARITSIRKTASRNETTTQSTGISPHKTTKMNESTVTTLTPPKNSLLGQSTRSISVKGTGSTTNLSTTTEKNTSDPSTKTPINSTSVVISILTTHRSKATPAVETTISDTTKKDVVITTLPITNDEASSGTRTSGVLSTNAKPASSTSIYTLIMKSTIDNTTSREAMVFNSSFPTTYSNIRSTTTGINSASRYSKTVGNLSTTVSTRAVDAIKLSASNTSDTTTYLSKLSTTTQVSTEETQTVPSFVRKKVSKSDPQLSSSPIHNALVTDSSAMNNDQTSSVIKRTISSSTTKARKQPFPKVSNSATETFTTSSNPEALKMSTDPSTKSTVSSATKISRIKTELSESVISELKSIPLLDSKVKDIPLVNSNNIIKPHIHETKKVVETIKQMELDVDKKHETYPPQNYYDSFFPGLFHSPENKENMLQSSVLTTTGKQV